MALATRRRTRGLWLLLMAAAAVLAVFFVSRDRGTEKAARGSVPEMTAAELEGATDADFLREIKSRAALDAVYKTIGENIDLYPRELLALALKNSEAAEFVAGWPDSIGRTYSADRIDVSGDVTEGELPYFVQWDARWGYAAYGGGVMGLTGCGPTCLSMVAVGLTGDKSANPLAVADYSAARGWYVEGVGTDWDLMRAGAEHFKLSWRELPLDAERICAALDAGDPVIASMGPGDFTDSGHYIVLRSYESGGFHVLDPNSPENSGEVWPYSKIQNQIMNLWAYSA